MKGDLEAVQVLPYLQNEKSVFGRIAKMGNPSRDTLPLRPRPVLFGCNPGPPPVCERRIYKLQHNSPDKLQHGGRHSAGVGKEDFVLVVSSDAQGAGDFIGGGEGVDKRVSPMKEGASNRTQFCILRKSMRLSRTSANSEDGA